MLKSAIRALGKYRRYIQAGLTLCIGIGLSASAWSVVYSWEEKFLQAELQTQLDKIAVNLEREFKGNLEVLQAMSALYGISDEIKEQEFQTFIKSALYRHPSIHAIAWLPYISNDQRLFYERNAQRQGYPDFQITEQTQQGKIVRAKQRQEYFPAYYLVSFSKTDILPGLDFAANPSYRLALRRAVDNNEIVVTGRSKLLEQQDNQLNFLVFIPIYSKNNSITSSVEPLILPSARREKLKGFVLGVFGVDAIVKIALQDVTLDSTNLYVQDATATEQERFLAFYEAKTKRLITNLNSEKSLNIGQRASCPDGSGCTRILNIENRRWLVRLLQTPEFITPQKHWRSWTTLTVGILLTCIVMIYLLILLRYTEQIEKVVKERTDQAKQLKKAYQELQQTQAQLVQTEKMSTLGLLVAGVAHEINNPINFIAGNLDYANSYTKDLLKLVALYRKHYSNSHPEIRECSEEMDLDFLMEDMPKLLSSMKVGAERILQLVLSLRNFSRLDESDMKVVNIHEGIESTLLILQNKLKTNPRYPEIEIIKKYGDLPLVECYVGQLNQVFMNIIANAIDALDTYNIEHCSQNIMESSRRITISTQYSHSNSITVRIADNGSGMREDVKKRLFEPFFTTKPSGKGTGLGLSISYQIIVEKHKGSLWCESALGQGTEFWISIPVRQRVRQATQELASNNCGR